MMGWICGVDIMVLAVVTHRGVEVIVSKEEVCWLEPGLQRSIDIEMGHRGWVSNYVVCEIKDG